MSYDDNIINQLEIVNDILHEYGQLPIFDNEDFIVKEMWYFQLIMKFEREHCIPFCLHFTSNGIRIDIDRMEEFIDISFVSIENYKNKVTTYLKLIFECSVQIKYCGKHYTKIYFIDNNGTCIHSGRYITGLYLKINCVTKEYPPIYNLK